MQNIIYSNKALQTIQNLCLLIVYNQHLIQFDQRDSTEILHRRTNISILVHRRKLHMLQYMFTLRQCDSLVDNRDIATRRWNGIVFKVIHSNHYKFYKNPLYRGIVEFNRMDVHLSLIDAKTQFKKALLNSIVNPFEKVL